MKKFIRFLLILFLLIALVVIYARYGGTEGLKTKEYTYSCDDNVSYIRKLMENH